MSVRYPCSCGARGAWRGLRTRHTLEPLAWHWSHWSGRLVNRGGKWLFSKASIGRGTNLYRIWLSLGPSMITPPCVGPDVQGYSKLRTRTALGPYSRPMPRSIGPPSGRCGSFESPLYLAHEKTPPSRILQWQSPQRGRWAVNSLIRVSDGDP